MKILFYIVIIITSYTVWGQEQGQSISRDTVKIEKLTVKPEFPGGAKAFASYINKEYGNTSNNGHGKMYIKFIVEKDGSVSNVTILESINKTIDEKIIKIMEKSPKWSPAIKDGKIVRASYTLPIFL